MSREVAHNQVGGKLRDRFLGSAPRVQQNQLGPNGDVLQKRQLVFQGVQANHLGPRHGCKKRQGEIHE